MAGGQGMTMQAAFVAAFVLCTLLATSRALPQGQGTLEQLADLPPAGRLNYDVIREGEKVGAHSVAFWHKGRDLAIKTRARISPSRFWVSRSITSTMRQRKAGSMGD
jgi:hypothetical protein